MMNKMKKYQPIKSSYGGSFHEDDEDCTTPPANSSPEAASKDQEGPTIETRPFIVINLVVIFITCATRLRLPLFQQLLYSHFATGILGNDTKVDTASNPCLQNEDNADHETIDAVQDMTSRTLFQLESVAFGLGCVSTFLLGALSPVLPRRLLILLPVTGYLARSVSVAAMTSWNTGITVLYVGCVLEGVSGGNCSIFLGSFLYTTDITPRNRKRTVGVALLEGLRGLIGAVFNIIAGHMIQRLGFVFTAYTALTFSALCVCCVLVLPDRKPPPTARLGVCDTVLASLGTTLSPCRLQPSHGGDPRTRLMVLMACGAFLLSFVTSFSLQRVRILYLMNLPFCWDAISIGWYQFGREILYNIATILSVPLLYRFLPGVGIGILGAFANMVEFIAYACASKGSHLMIALALSFGQGLPVLMVRGETSILLGPDMQGPLFANLALMENVSFMVGTAMINVYTATLDSYPGLIFLVFAAIKILVVLHLGAFQVMWLRKRNIEGRAILQR